MSDHQATTTGCREAAAECPSGGTQAVGASLPAGTPRTSPRLAILFWCYKDPRFCARRLARLRRDNARIAIYVLFSGPASQAGEFARATGPLADDFYASRCGGHAAWRWLNGDLLIVDWFTNRGRQLEWDTVVVVQWDMLVLDRAVSLFGHLGPDEILLSGMRAIRDVQDWWGWVRRDRPAHRSRYDAFLTQMRGRFGFAQDPTCCVFIVVCLPRVFLTLYAPHASDAGFLEYRVPIYAQALGVPFASAAQFPVWTDEDPDASRRHLRSRALNGIGREIATADMLKNLCLPTGSRIFHPVRREVPEIGGPALLDVLAMALQRAARGPDRLEGDGAR